MYHNLYTLQELQMKKILEALSIASLFTFCYNFSWELYPTLILGAFAISFSISNRLEVEKETFSLEEILLFAFAIVAAIVVYMNTNLIGMVAIGLYVVLLVQVGDMKDETKKRGLTNKEYYGS